MPPADVDPEREYSPVEEERLTLQLRALVERVFVHDSRERTFSIALLCEWHRSLFNGVRAHGGRMRDGSYGEEHLLFGPNRSPDRKDVPELMTQYVRMALGVGDDMEHLEATQVVRGALHIHVELIRIHPFRDGNGRVGRLALSYWLKRCGLPPFMFDGAKDRYIAAMNTAMASRNIEPLFNLALRLYIKQLQITLSSG